MFIFRLNKVVIRDNGTKKSGLGIFGHDFADVSFLSIITVTNKDLLNLDAFIRAKSPAEQAKGLEPAVQSAIASRRIEGVSRVTDDAVLTFGDEGVALSEAEHIPESFNWTFAAIKSNAQLRDIGLSVDEVLNDSEFSEVTSGLAALLTSAAVTVNPACAVGMAIARITLKVAAKRMKAKVDRPLGMLSMSLNRFEHYFHGERKRDGIADSTSNMWVD